MVETVLFLGVIAFAVVGNLVSFGSGIWMLTNGHMNRGWEQPWVLMLRCVLTLTLAAVFLYCYQSELLGAFGALIVFIILEMPQSIYVILNDRKHTLANGGEWKWL